MQRDGWPVFIEPPTWCHFQINFTSTLHPVRKLNQPSHRAKCNCVFCHFTQPAAQTGLDWRKISLCERTKITPSTQNKWHLQRLSGKHCMFSCGELIILTFCKCAAAAHEIREKPSDWLERGTKSVMSLSVTCSYNRESTQHHWQPSETKHLKGRTSLINPHSSPLDNWVTL